MKYVTRILAFLFVAFVLIFVGVQVSRVLLQEYTTEVAASYTTAQSIETVGIAVRSEQVISVD